MALRNVSIDRYLADLMAKNKKPYIYRWRQGNVLVIYQMSEDEYNEQYPHVDTKHEVFVGPMKRLNDEQYAVEFKKAGIRCLVEIFM